MGHIIGIDLGTTNSVVAFLENGEPKIITNEEGGRVTPSVVGFSDNDEVLVGEIARRQAVMNPESTIASIKRFMGRRFSEVQDDLALVSYELVEGDNGDAAVKVQGKRYSPPEISARVLQRLKRAAEIHLGEEVTEAVITVPAYFNDAQRKATKDAGAIAGLKVRRIVNEPTAAALAYGMQRSDERLVAVYDFGGGTFDISILEVGESVVEVLATAGDSHLGGDDIDNLLVERLVALFKSQTDIDVSGDKMVMQRLREAAEKAKKELSSIPQTEINLPFLTADASGPKHLNAKFSRAELNELIDDLVDRTLKACAKALLDAGKEARELDEVILVGGSTRIPLVQERVEAFFKRPPHRGVNPDEVVALGAAVQGGVLSGDLDNVLLLDVTPLSLGLETTGGVMAVVVPRNTTVPIRKTKTFSTVTDNQSTVELHVCQGERDFVADNRSLGRFELSGIPPAKRAEPQIEVVFDIDANGILTVSATEKKTGQSAEIKITGAGGLTDEEVRRAVQDASGAEERDKLRRKVVERRNQLQGLVYAVSRQLVQQGPELVAGQAESLNEALELGRACIDNTDAELACLEEAIEKLTAAARELREVEFTKELKERAAKEQAEAEQEQESTTFEDGEGEDGEAEADEPEEF